MITTIRANLWPRPAGWLPIGTAELRPMRRLDRAIHAAIESFVGWDQMPAAVLARPLDPTRCVVAAWAADAYVGQLG